MMAFERIEPFGALHEEFMVGQLCALIANIHLKLKGGGRFKDTDFMPALKKSLKGSDEPISLADPEAQTQLIMSTIFGRMRGGLPGV